MKFKYFSVDIETTGLDPDACQTLSIGIVFDDLVSPLAELPTYHGIISRKFVQGEPYALRLNADLLMAEGKPANTVINEAVAFIRDYNHEGKANLTGKNFAGFDNPFLEKFPQWRQLGKHHRVLDIGSLYFDPKIDDVLPGLKDCKERAGIGGEVSHDALEDAWDVVKCVRKFYGVAL